MCALRKEAHNKKEFTPVGSIETLQPGTWYLEKIDEMFRRTYAVKN